MNSTATQTTTTTAHYHSSPKKSHRRRQSVNNTINKDPTSRYFPHPANLADARVDDPFPLAIQVYERCRSQLQNTKFGTLYTGRLGVACYLPLLIAEQLPEREAVEYLEDAKQSAIHALQETPKDFSGGGSTTTKKFRVTLLEGAWVGAKAMLAVICDRLSQTSEAQAHASELLQTLDEAVDRLPPSDCDILYGRAGALQVIWFLRVHLRESRHNFQEQSKPLVIKWAKEILLEGMERSLKTRGRQQQREEDGAAISLPLVWEWKGKAYLGAAHGIVGILHSLLGLAEDEWSELEDAFGKAQPLNQNEANDMVHENNQLHRRSASTEKLEFLASFLNIGDHNDTVDMMSDGPVRKKRTIKDILNDTIKSLPLFCYDSGNLQSRLEAKGGDRLVHWCHGAPGYCLLLCKAYQVYGDDAFLQHAKRLANSVVFPRGLLQKGVGLCHGISGNAFCFLIRGGYSTNPTAWRRKGEQFAAFALANLPELEPLPDRPYSLYEGLGGLAALLLYLAGQGQRRNFPLYY